MTNDQARALARKLTSDAQQLVLCFASDGFNPVETKSILALALSFAHATSPNDPIGLATYLKMTAETRRSTARRLAGDNVVPFPSNDTRH